MKMLLAFVFALFLPFFAYAQEVVQPVLELPPVTNTDFLQLLIQSLGGLKGASALAIAGTAVQVLLKFLATPWAGGLLKNVKGGTKLLVVSGLSMLGGVLALMVPPTSLSLGAALVHSTTLTAFMVFANQLYQQLLEKPKTS